MKKAFVDQILLGVFLFATLIVLGATVADNTLARDKYYNLKKITDNAALAMAKYYVNVNANTQEAEDIADAFLDETNLGEEVKQSIVYTWDFTSDPNTVTASITDYKHNTFWYRFLDLASFDIDASSIAQIAQGGDRTSTTDLLPFGVNACSDSHLKEGSSLVFDLRGWDGYQETDYTEFYGIDLGDACTPTGNSNWAHFKNEVKNFYVDNNILLNDEELLDVDTDTGFCIPAVKSLAMEQNNDPKQISQSFKNLENGYDLVGVQADIAVFECGSTAGNLIIEKFLRVEFNSNPSDSYIKVKNDYDVFQFDVKIIGWSEANKILLTK